MASIKDIVFDSPHPASAARFWAQALDDYEIAPYDQEELTRLRSLGINDPEDDPTVLLVGMDGRLPRIFFQLVPEDKWGKNRVHLDLSATDAAAEVKRLCALGARVHADRETGSRYRTPMATSSALCAREPGPAFGLIEGSPPSRHDRLQLIHRS
ncbi:VOC family protein [Streptomyces sp. NPDC047061]|uniref:VOC family protein n=1 Tax=Streptomyces sp. NPDC047061 TaxID=3154605 RepID=UPI0033F48185